MEAVRVDNAVEDVWKYGEMESGKMRIWNGYGDDRGGRSELWRNRKKKEIGDGQDFLRLGGGILLEYC